MLFRMHHQMLTDIANQTIPTGSKKPAEEVSRSANLSEALAVEFCSSSEKGLSLLSALARKGNSLKKRQ
jgi:hypothetical protein